MVEVEQNVSRVVGLEEKCVFHALATDIILMETNAIYVGVKAIRNVVFAMVLESTNVISAGQKDGKTVLIAMVKGL
jgi:hypothetical protein